MNTLALTTNYNLQTLIWAMFHFISFLVSLIKPLALGLVVAAIVLFVAANPMIVVVGLIIGVYTYVTYPR